MTNSAKSAALLDRNLVYGERDGLVFIPRSQAERLCALWHAATTATWNELRSMLPAVEIEDIVSLLEEQQQESWQPYGDTRFDGEQLYGGDGDWPEQDMMHWIPSEIRYTYGEEKDTVLSGPYLYFDPKIEDELVSAFQASGFSVNRDDELVKNASGECL